MAAELVEAKPTADRRGRVIKFAFVLSAILCALADNAGPVLRIYTLDGVLVDDLSGRFGPGERSVVWRAPSAANAVNVVKCSTGGKTKTGKIVLLK